MKEHIEKLLDNHDNQQSYQAMMVLVFSLERHLDLQSLTALVKHMMRHAQRPETPASMKAHLFIVVEFLFSRRSFDQGTLKQTITVLFNCEEILSQHLSDQVYVVSFLRAFLQVILNYYSQMPFEAKPFIPAFLGAVLELFADKSINDRFAESHTNEVGLESLDPSNPVPILEKNAFVSGKTYSGLAEQVFEMLVEHTFDAGLFADLGSNPADELSDIFANFDFRKDVSHGAGRSASTSSKIFALMNYALSERFESSRSFMCKMLLLMLNKINGLQLSFSEGFHANLAKMAGVLLGLKASTKEADRLLGRIFEMVDLDTAFAHLAADLNLNLSDGSILEKEEFTHMLYIFGHHCRDLDFRFFLVRVLPLLQHVAQKQAAQMTQIEELVLKKLFESVKGFKKFETLWATDDPSIFSQSCACLLQTLMPLAEDLIGLQTPFLGIFQSFLMSLVKVHGSRRQITAAMVAQFRSANVLGRFCLRVAQSKRNLLEENCLQLIVRLLPRDYIAEVFQKNCDRLVRNLTDPDLMEKSLKEAIILGFIVRACENMDRDDSTLRKMFQFLEQLIQFKKNLREAPRLRASDKKKFAAKANCLVLQLLTFTTPNMPFNLYKRTLELACQTSQDAETESNEDKKQGLDMETPSAAAVKKGNTPSKYDQHALRFCLQFILSVQINTSQLTGGLFTTKEAISEMRQEILFKMAKHFLPVVVVNIKSRNIKTRRYAKEMLKKLVELEHSGSAHRRIRVNSLSVSAVIAGLAGSSSYSKSCAVQALGYLFKGFHRRFEEELRQSLLELVLMLTRERNKEVFLAVMKFVKTFVKLEKKEAILANKEAICGTIFHEECELGEQFRVKVRGVIMVLMHKLGREETSLIVGDKWANMVRYVVKKIKRPRRRQTRTNEAAVETGLKVKEEPEDQDFDARTFLEERRKLVAERKRLANNSFNGFVGEIFKRYLDSSLAQVEPQTNRILEESEDEDEVDGDFLDELGDTSRLKQFFQEGVGKSKKKGKESGAKARAKPKGDVYFDEETGKLIITQKRIIPKKLGKRKLSDLDDAETKSSQVPDLKRKRPREFDSKWKRENSEKRFKKIIEQVTRRNRHLNEAVHTIKETGQRYRNKSGGGDAAFRDRLSPHAFIQFNPVAISKKLRSKARKAFEIVVNSRKKTTGALKNLKIRAK